MKPLHILLVIFILYYLLKSNKEHFTQFKPVDWSVVSKERCIELEKERKEIEATLSSCSPSAQEVGQRDKINNKVACIDAINRQIFNDREGASWCKQKPKDNGKGVVMQPQNPKPKDNGKGVVMQPQNPNGKGVDKKDKKLIIDFTTQSNKILNNVSTLDNKDNINDIFISRDTAKSFAGL